MERDEGHGLPPTGPDGATDVTEQHDETMDARLDVARHAAAFDQDTTLSGEHLTALALVSTIELGSALTEGLDATLQRIVDILHPNLDDVRGVSIILWSETLGAFTTSASTIPQQPSSEASRRVRRRGATSWIVDHATPLVINDIDEDPFGANDMLRQYDSWAYAGVPILEGDRALGVLYVMAGRRHRFGPADVRFLTIIADRCTVVLRTARANERTQELLARAQDLAEVTARLASLDPFEDRLQDVTERSSLLLRGDVRIDIKTPERDHRFGDASGPARRQNEREIAVRSGGGLIQVTVRLRQGRSSPPEAEARETLRSIADQISLAAERDHANAALVESNAALEQFAHVASHDLKSPLSSVLGFLDLAIATEGDSMNERLSMLLGRALDGGHRMREIIDALLSYAKMREEDPEFVETPLDDLVGQVLGIIVSSIEESSARIDVAPDLPVVEVDPAAFRIVLQNLLANAIKFVPAGESPIVSITGETTADGRVELVVADQGIGVPDDARERVFELFERASSKHRGTGIGLATVQRIVESHGGTVHLEPNEPLGTRAIVRLPARRP